ncbi:copper amine oxidase N-terminal domain-containing protein [Paenibacillus sp. ACRRX]|uniref:copper amine oxidase N-terminal domain-containing protein n=1 Tax=Paenibacillus sp. ACRRX TaxID=2918206 RepID=UPI001EF6662B|nr:copper amine oxidase N-terminal domain-containing protein [Paenibacillus sp. ACRRX]MCG7410277.1 copper amine oxidase N-terminal domain-containing protein [Paenibacillus sp. ACRRX]
MRIRTSLAAMLAALLIVLTGCQAVGGVDIGEVVNRTSDLKSAETKETVSIKLDVSKDAELTTEESQFINIINGLQLDLSTKMESPDRVSSSGTIKITGKSVPFQLAVDDKQVVVHVEGGKTPLVIPATTKEMEELDIPQLDVEQLKQFRKSMVKFFTKHAPNPKVTTVTPVTEQIFGQSQSLSQIHMEFGADETIGWVRSFLKSILADEQGTKAWLTEVGKLYGPLVGQSMEAYGVSDKSTNMVKDGEVFALIAFKWLKENGEKSLDELDKAWTQVVKEDADMAVVLGNKTKLKLDLYADAALNLNKTNIELNVALPKSEDVPLSGITFKASTEVKNHNQSITIDKINATNAVNVLEQTLTPGQWLRHFSPDSAVHQLLKDAGISRKYVTLPISQGKYDDWLIDGPAPFVKNGVTMVPLRYVAEHLDADVKWDNKASQARIVEDLTGKVIIIKLNSKQVTVDGSNVAKKLDAAPVMKDSTVYVPLRDIALLLGAKVGYEKGEYMNYATVTRE